MVEHTEPSITKTRLVRFSTSHQDYWLPLWLHLAMNPRKDVAAYECKVFHFAALLIFVRVNNSANSHRILFTCASLSKWLDVLCLGESSSKDPVIGFFVVDDRENFIWVLRYGRNW